MEEVIEIKNPAAGFFILILLTQNANTALSNALVNLVREPQAKKETLTIKHTKTMKLLLFILPLGIASCKHRELSDIEVIKFNYAIIDSLKKVSDTSYISLLGRADFYTAEYYITRGDSSENKILKDSAGNVVGIVQMKNDVTLFAAEYYPNGQVMGNLSFLSGKIEGPAKYYYRDGRIRSLGVWKDNSRIGTWREYFETGVLKEIIHYDNSGAIINTEEFSN